MPQKYSIIKKEVDEFIKKNPDITKSYKDGLAQIGQEPAFKSMKNMYLLAYIQNTINSLYPADTGVFTFPTLSKGPVNAGNHWLNSIIEEMLVSEEFNSEAQKYLV